MIHDMFMENILIGNTSSLCISVDIVDTLVWSWHPTLYVGQAVRSPSTLGVPALCACPHTDRVTHFNWVTLQYGGKPESSVDHWDPWWPGWLLQAGRSSHFTNTMIRQLSEETERQLGRQTDNAACSSTSSCCAFCRSWVLRLSLWVYQLFLEIW